MALNKLINLNKFIFFNLLTISLISTSLIGLLWFLADYRYFNEMIAEQEATFYDQKKQMLRDEVGRVVNYIDYMKATTESRLKQSIRSRTYEAYEIASAIYKENEGNLTEAEIKVAVKNVLRRLRFNNGRGYYFATRLDGLEELFADRPELEGVNLIDMQDTQGQFVIRDMIELVRT
ncbi:MAG: sensory box histidine kinase/response regulator protein, partial [Desulfobulbaceae bacterium]